MRQGQRTRTWKPSRRERIFCSTVFMVETWEILWVSTVIWKSWWKFHSYATAVWKFYMAICCLKVFDGIRSSKYNLDFTTRNRVYHPSTDIDPTDRTCSEENKLPFPYLAGSMVIGRVAYRENCFVTALFRDADYLTISFDTWSVLVEPWTVKFEQSSLGGSSALPICQN